MIKRILTGKRGQGLVEYALILVLVAIVVMVILALLGPAIGNVFSNIVAAIENAGGGGTITGVTASINHGIVTVRVWTSKDIEVSVSSTSGTVSPPSQVCSGSCTFTITGAAAHGTATASGGGSSRSDSW
jgi:pilus assembly protein Flp/PilA